MNEKKMTRRLSYPYIVWMAIFVIVPLIIVCIYGLTDKTGAFTLENVKSIASPVHLKALFLSLKLSIISTVLCFVLALPLALVIRGMHLKSSGFIIFVFILPMWMNFLLRTIAWQSLLEKTGVINMILQSIGLPKQNLINTEGAIILGMIYNFLPFMVLPIYNSLIKIPQDTFDAAKDLGANWIQTLWRITLPQILPGIVSGITMVFVPAMTTFVISNLLGGAKINLIGNVIEQEFTTANNWYGRSRLSIDFEILILGSMAVSRTLRKRRGGCDMVGKALAKISGRIYLALIFIFLYAPIATLIVLSFNESRFRGKWGGFSLKWYESLFSSREIMDALWTTLLLAFLSALIATIFGTMVSFAMNHMKKLPRMILMTVTNIPMLNADIVTGISLMLLFIALRYRMGFGSVLIAHITFNLPYVVLSVLPKLKQMNKSVFEAALDLGASRRYAFVKVVFPDILPGILTGIFVVLYDVTG